jgi:hypothetical protein
LVFEVTAAETVPDLHRYSLLKQLVEAATYGAKLKKIKIILRFKIRPELSINKSA